MGNEMKQVTTMVMCQIFVQIQYVIILLMLQKSPNNLEDFEKMNFQQFCLNKFVLNCTELLVGQDISSL